MWLLLLLPVQKQTAKRHANSAQFRDCGWAKKKPNGTPVIAACHKFATRSRQQIRQLFPSV
jgi:hypothetical protein